MQKIIRKIFSPSSIRLNTLVLVEVVMLLAASLGGLFFFTRKALVEEAKMDAEHRLDGTIEQVNNVMKTIEQSTGNIYYDLLNHLDQPDCMANYCRRLVECNPNIVGCAIAFRPNYYPDHEMFIKYVHRKKYNSPEIIISDDSVKVAYTQQKWFSETMKTCRLAWIFPENHQNKRVDPIITYCLPIRDKSKECVGVIAVGLSVELLSQIVLETKPMLNSYSTLLAQDGSYIVHPDRHKLGGENVFEQPEVAESPSAVEAAKAMIQGKSGNMSFEMNDFTWYLFYKPFVRNSVRGSSEKSLYWSVATIYPKDDIFGEYNHLIIHVLGVVLITFLVFFLMCKRAIKKQMKPLIYLTESAERISEGHYDENIPNVRRDDEVGEFYKNFQLMYQALTVDVAKQEEQRSTILEHHDKLKNIYKRIEEDELVKKTFLHNVTNRMIAPAESISNSVTTLCDNYENITLSETNKEINNIKQQSETILELLSHKFDISSNKEGKEESHE
jgi:methyl-accepting chemotaxis protein/sigma-B regulation protein RsbU (phosphoserine phosphatase)